MALLAEKERECGERQSLKNSIIRVKKRIFRAITERRLGVLGLCSDVFQPRNITLARIEGRDKKAEI